MQHFVINEVLHRIPRHSRMIKHPADDDCVVGGIVMSEHITCNVPAPRHLRTRHKPVEKSRIERLEDLIEIIELPVWRLDPLSPSQMPYQFCLDEQRMACNVLAVPGIVPRVDGLAIQFRQQNVYDRMQYRVRRAFQKVGKSHEDLAFAQSNGVVDIGKRIEPNAELRYRGPGSDFAVTLLKQKSEIFSHTIKISTSLPISCNVFRRLLFIQPYAVASSSPEILAHSSFHARRQARN